MHDIFCPIEHRIFIFHVVLPPAEDAALIVAVIDDPAGFFIELELHVFSGPVPHVSPPRFLSLRFPQPSSVSSVDHPE